MVETEANLPSCDYCGYRRALQMEVSLFQAVFAFQFMVLVNEVGRHVSAKPLVVLLCGREYALRSIDNVCLLTSNRCCICPTEKFTM